MLTKPRNLGTRRVCTACGTKYYDLNRTEPTCPKCGAPAELEEPQDPRALAMARLKADSGRIRRTEDEELPFGLNEEGSSSSDDDDDIDEFGDFTDETSDDDSDDDDDEDGDGDFEDFED